MAIIRAAQQGYFNAPSTWVGGVVPSAGDIAVSGPFDIVLNVSTAAKLSNTLADWVAAGGVADVMQNATVRRFSTMSVNADLSVGGLRFDGFYSSNAASLNQCTLLQQIDNVTVNGDVVYVPGYSFTTAATSGVGRALYVVPPSWSGNGAVINTVITGDIILYGGDVVGTYFYQQPAIFFGGVNFTFNLSYRNIKTNGAVTDGVYHSALMAESGAYTNGISINIVQSGYTTHCAANGNYTIFVTAGVGTVHYTSTSDVFNRGIINSNTGEAILFGSPTRFTLNPPSGKTVFSGPWSRTAMRIENHYGDSTALDLEWGTNVYSPVTIVQGTGSISTGQIRAIGDGGNPYCFNVMSLNGSVTVAGISSGDSTNTVTPPLSYPVVNISEAVTSFVCNGDIVQKGMSYYALRLGAGNTEVTRTINGNVTSPGTKPGNIVGYSILWDFTPMTIAPDNLLLTINGSVTAVDHSDGNPQGAVYVQLYGSSLLNIPAKVHISGDVYAVGGVSGVFINDTNNTGATILVDGTLHASANTAAVAGISTAPDKWQNLTVVALKLAFSPEGTPPVWLARWKLKDQGSSITTIPTDTDGVTVTLNEVPNGVIPSPTDVRIGISVGHTQGTAYIPAPSNVVAGVPVDGTVGTLSIAADVAAIKAQTDQLAFLSGKVRAVAELDLGLIPTQVAEIKAKTDQIVFIGDKVKSTATVGDVTLDLGTLPQDVATIKGKTDQLTFVNNKVNANADAATVDLGTLPQDVATIKGKTDQLTFTNNKVNANADAATVDLGTLPQDVATIKGKTDQLTFTNNKVNANADVQAANGGGGVVFVYKGTQR